MEVLVIVLIMMLALVFVGVYRAIAMLIAISNRLIVIERAVVFPLVEVATEVSAVKTGIKGLKEALHGSNDSTT